MNLFTDLGEQVFLWTCRTSIQVTPLIVLVFLAQGLLKRRLTPGLRYALILLVVIGLLLPANPASPFSIGNLLPASAKFGAQAPTFAVSHSQATRSVSVLETDRLPATASADAGQRKLSIYEVASVVWSSGCLCLIIIAVWRYRNWQKLLKGGRRITEPGVLCALERARILMGVRQPITLIVVDRLSSPAVFGVQRVRLLLPQAVLQQLSLPELHLVFLHEMAHVRRNDVLLGWVLMEVQFLHWFNPLVWLALHRLRADRELVCDALALQKLAPDERLGYGQVLLKLMAGFSLGPRVFPSAVPVMSKQSEIKWRIIMIKHHRQPSRAARFGAGILVVALGCITLTRAREQKSDFAKTSLAPSQRQEKPLLQARGETERGQQADHNIAGPPFNREQGISPSASAPLVVRIDAGGNLRLGREPKPLTLEQFKTKLISEMGISPDLEVRLTADKMTPYSRIAELMGILRDSKISKVSLRTMEAPPSATAEQVQPTATIVKIAIKYIGPHMINDDQIHTNIHVKVGEQYRPEVVDSDVRELYATGLFANIRVAIDPVSPGLSLTYNVQWRPRLIGIKFNGNTEFSEAELVQHISSKVGGALDERKLFNDGQAIQNLYERAGYEGTVVKHVMNIVEEGARGSVIFEINTHPK